MALVDGIWEYDEGDAASPTFSELLNLLGDSVRDRITALEAALTEDTGWVDLILLNGWTVVGAQTPQVRRLGDQVYQRGRVQGGTGTIATLPAGFRPSQPLSFTARDGGGNNVGIFIVVASGEISPGSTLTTPNLTATWLVG